MCVCLLPFPQSTLVGLAEFSARLDRDRNLCSAVPDFCVCCATRAPIGGVCLVTRETSV